MEADSAAAATHRGARSDRRHVSAASPGSAGTPPASPEEYRARRRAYYDRFPEFWATFPDEVVEEYAIYGAMAVSPETVATVRRVAERLFHVLSRVLEWAQVAPEDVLREIGVPEAALDYARIAMPGMAPTVIGRFEFALTVDGPKLLELNAETPTFIVELFRMNGQVCTDFGLADPNWGSEGELRRALGAAVEAGLAVRETPPPGHVVFTSHGDHQEDHQTAEYLRSLLEPSPLYTTAYCPLDALVLTRDELRDESGQPIDVLYKLYPTEQLVLDCDPDGTPVGRMLMGLIEAGRLAVINPPVSFLLQTKGLMALTWALHEAGTPLLDREEHEWIARYMLPTYLEPVDEAGHPVFAGRYIAKPVYGREGCSITVHDHGTLLEAHPNRSYSTQRYIYQQHVTLPRAGLLTEMGHREVNLVFNCFVVGGRASAVGLRAGASLILDDYAFFVPTCYEARP